MRCGHSCCIWSLASRPLQMQRQQPPAAPCVTARWHAPSLSPALVLQPVTRLQNSRALPPRHTHARQSSCPACSADLQLRATPTDAYMLAQRPASLTSQSSEPITAIDPPSIGHYTFYMAAHLPAGPPAAATRGPQRRGRCRRPCAEACHTWLQTSGTGSAPLHGTLSLGHA